MNERLYRFDFLTFLLFFTLCFFYPTGGVAGKIFSDDFSTWKSDYLLRVDDSNPPGGWSYGNGGAGATYNSVKHYAGEVTTPGRKGAKDRSLKAWRHSGFTDGYDGLLLYTEANLHGNKEIYHRWYMKIPTDFSLSEGSCHMNYLKLWRYYISTTAGGNGTQIYLNFNGSSFQNATMKVTGTTTGSWKSLVPVSEIQDGQWHSHELRIKLNSPGNANGEVQYWLDGTERAHLTGLNYGIASNEYFSKVGMGLGNHGGRHCSPEGKFQSSWRAIEFDDFALSTTYIGPDGDGGGSYTDTEAPTKPSSLIEQNSSSTELTLGWNASTDNIGVTKYNIFRDGTKIGTSVSPSFADNSVVPETTYDYSVSALDAAGNESALSNTLQVTTPQTSSPPTSPPPSGTTILTETWENNNINNWNDDLIVGDTHIDTTPVYSGNYAIKMESSNPGNYVSFFGDHSGVDDNMVTDITIQEYYYPKTGFQWPTGLKLWVMNSFESWGAGYNLAEGQSKPHTWAPYYMTIWANNKGELAGQLVRADGLGGTGALWQDYHQNIGAPVSLTPGTWNKIKVRLKLNTLGKNDGVFQVWLNDELKCNYSNMNYRGTYSGNGWNHLMMSMDAEPSHPQTQWISRDNILITTGGGTETLIQIPTGFQIVQGN